MSGRAGAIVLAAGASTRFAAGHKLLAALDGRPVLEHVLAAASDAGLDDAVVVLGARAGDIRAAVDLHGARPVECPDWAEGQSASLRRGLDALGDVDAAVILLGDQPRIGAEAIRRVLAARGPGADAVRATWGGLPGHPVVLERALFDRVRALRGDRGARALLAGARPVACDGLGSPLEIDTVEDLAGA